MQELEKILEEIEDHVKKFVVYETSYDYISFRWVKQIIRKHMNDGWIPVEERLPKVPGKYWVTIRHNDGRVSEPILAYFRGIPDKWAIDKPKMREYEMWGIYSVFNEDRVIAWRPYYIPEPYRPERRI